MCGYLQEKQNPRLKRNFYDANDSVRAAHWSKLISWRTLAEFLISSLKPSKTAREAADGER